MKPSRRQIAKATIELIEQQGIEKTMAALALYIKQERPDLSLDLFEKDLAAIAEQHGQLNITLASARPLPSPSVKKLTDYLKNLTQTKEAYLHETLDPSLIGGVKASTSEYELDWTVKSKLQQMIKGGL